MLPPGVRSGMMVFVIPLLAAMVTVQAVPEVHDGDTLRLSGQSVRLEGIDAPEMAQLCVTAKRKWRCGDQARGALVQMVAGAPVRCEVSGADRYRRWLATCWRGSVNLNQAMVAQGWAVAYRQYSMRYVAVEAQARNGQRGVWASRFDMPWDWRAAARNRR